MKSRPNRWSTTAASALATGLLLALPTAASASSFQILEQSPSRLGTAFAGTASINNDATSAYFNPAGMAEADQREISLGVSRIGVYSTFDNDGSTTGTGALQQPLPGDEDETDKPGYVPSFYIVQPLEGPVTLGLGVNAPFGLSSKYDEDWQGRYHGTNSSLTTFNINPSLSFTVTDTFSFGVGIDFQRTDAELDNEIDSYNACRGGGGSQAQCVSSQGGPGNRSADSSVDVTADDTDVVFDLSMHWQPTKRTSVGVVYRQGADFTLTGRADFDQSGSCQADPYCSGALNALGGHVEADVPYPDTITASVSHAFTDAFRLHADIAWTGWSALDKIDIKNSDNGRVLNTLALDYEDTMRYALGATYQAGGGWTWRAGVAYDEAPQTDADHVTPRIPDQDRAWLSTGFRYAFSADTSVDVGYAHLFVDDADIDKEKQGNTLRGSFDAGVDTVAAQINWRF